MRATWAAWVVASLVTLANALPAQKHGSSSRTTAPRTSAPRAAAPRISAPRASAPRTSAPRVKQAPRASSPRPPSAAKAPSTVLRDKSGRIARSESAKRQFQKQSGYPGGRKGYVVDHIVPLACGGADAPSNMQWQTEAAAKAKDRTERAGCGRRK
jgi:hypothetical protein